MCWRSSAFTYPLRLSPHTPHPVVMETCVCVCVQWLQHSVLSKRKVYLSLLRCVPVPQGHVWLPLLRDNAGGICFQSAGPCRVSRGSWNRASVGRGPACLLCLGVNSCFWGGTDCACSPGTLRRDNSRVGRHSLLLALLKNKLALLESHFQGGGWKTAFSRRDCSREIMRTLLLSSEICLSFVASRNSEELSGLAFLDCNALLLCCAKGQLCLADVRQPQSPLEAASVPSAPCGERWCMGVGRGPQGSDSSCRPVARLSSGGHLTLTDVRKTSESLASAKCRVPSPSSGAEFLCVSWAPALESCLAVSGMCFGPRSLFPDAFFELYFYRSPVHPPLL